MCVVVFCTSLASVTSAASCYKRLYIDGNFVGDANATEGLEFDFERLTIGAEGNRWYMYNEYVGKMDEFAVYAGVLSDPCIAAHYAVKDSNTVYTAVVSHDNPLLWLRFEDPCTANEALCENSGMISAIDANYITTGGGPITQVAGINAGSQAINIPDRINDPCDAVNALGHCVDVWDGNRDFSDLWGDGDLTVELWVNYIDLNDYPRFFQHNGDYQQLGSYGLIAQLNDGNSMAVTGGGAAHFINFTNDTNDGQWHHLVVTFDSTYDEPNLVDTNSYAAEVAADNPILWLRFDHDTARDYSVADGNHWVGYGGSTSLIEKEGGIGKVLYLVDSDSSYAAATNNPDSPPNEGDPNWYGVFGDEYAFAPNDITFELWYRAPGTWPQDDYAYFFQQVGPWDWPPGSETGSDRAPGVGKNEADTIRVMGGSTTWYSGRSVKFDGKWHQLVVTYDEDYQGNPNSMHAQLYQDGEFVGDNTFTGSDAKLGPELSHVMVGARNDIGLTYNAFRGFVDEFAIYEGILDPNRIEAHYSAWQPKTCAELIERGGLKPWQKADRNGNCIIDFYDFAILAEEWALCNDPAIGGTECPPNW